MCGGFTFSASTSTELAIRLTRAEAPPGAHLGLELLKVVPDAPLLPARHVLGIRVHQDPCRVPAVPCLPAALPVHSVPVSQCQSGAQGVLQRCHATIGCLNRPHGWPLPDPHPLATLCSMPHLRSGSVGLPPMYHINVYSSIAACHTDAQGLPYFVSQFTVSEYALWQMATAGTLKGGARHPEVLFLTLSLLTIL